MKVKAVLLATVFLAGCAATMPSVEGPYNQAKVAYDAGRYVDAVKGFQDYIAQYPDSPMTEVAMYYLADSYRQAGKTDEAKKAYEALIKKYQTGSWVDWAKRDLNEMK